MSTAPPEGEVAPEEAKIRYPKPQRVLACVLCQQRKVKCDRKCPCASCVKSGAQCVPATKLTRERKRRFPERELLERLRKYEGLLRQHHIKFEPLHKDHSSETDKDSPQAYGSCDPDDEQPKHTKADWLSPVDPDRASEPKDISLTSHSESRKQFDDASDSSDDDVLRQDDLEKGWSQVFDDDNHLLFGSQDTAVDLFTLHPEPVQIIRLWQVYLDNVNPLLKVTHIPSLQGRIFDAASNVSSIHPTSLEALMFSIYCISITSLRDEDCLAMLNLSKKDALRRYHFGCQQALLNCGFLRSSDRDCLTALFFYLISIRPRTSPQSLSAMLGVAVRIAQRMGIQSELILARCSVLEAEMRRRLWWSLVLFDTRIGEMSSFKASMLTPSWDCRIPLNVNDSDLRAEMREPPQEQNKNTEAIFAVVRCELGNFSRHTKHHIDSADPGMKSGTGEVRPGPVLESSELHRFGKTIEDKYLKFCDPENPLEFMTTWTARGYIAKCLLVNHSLRQHNPSTNLTEAERNAVILHSILSLEYDTKIATSPLTRKFLWLLHLYYPFVAYIHITQNLRRKPMANQALRAWEAMSDNYEAHFEYPHSGSEQFSNMIKTESVFFQYFTRIILQAWTVREGILKQSGEAVEIPRIVQALKDQPLTRPKSTYNPNSGSGSIFPDIRDNDSIGMPMNYDLIQNPLSNMGEQQSVFSGQGEDPQVHISGSLDLDIDHLDWSAMDWSNLDWSTTDVPSSRSTNFMPI